jgi:hypothetical protein
VSTNSDEHIRFIKSLVLFGVKFIIIGNYAAIFHDVRRNTGALDILIEPSKINGAKLIEALKNVGLILPDINPEEFENELVLSFGLEPEAVDIMNVTPGIEFEAAYLNAATVEFSGEKIRVINIRDLNKNKQSLNRPGEKAHLDAYDPSVLQKILSQKAQDS